MTSITETKERQQFTPGEWRVEPCNAGGGLLYRGDRAGKHEQFSVQIVPIADAHLMAAAPAMFEALEEIEEGFGPYKMDKLAFAESVIAHSQELARVALAQASGEK